jgi:hypothetical protein
MILVKSSVAAMLTARPEAFQGNRTTLTWRCCAVAPDLALLRCGLVLGQATPGDLWVRVDHRRDGARIEGHTLSSNDLGGHFALMHGFVRQQHTARSIPDSGDVVLHALVRYYLGLPYWAQGDYRRAIDCFGQTVTFFDGVRRHERFGLSCLHAFPCLAHRVPCRAGHVHRG